MDEAPPTVPAPMQRLNSYASSSSSSGVVTNFHSKSLSQNLSCESSRSNFSTFESLDLNLSDCSDLAGSLPSCATSATASTETDSATVISSSALHPSVYVSMSAKSPCSFSRHNPIGTHQHSTKRCRAVTRSPVDFREGRRASDGLVAQGILHSHSEYPLHSGVAFNSQRLHEACKAKGVLELHVLQKEAAQLKTQYQSNVPPDEMTARQIQHSQFHVNPNKAAMDLNVLYQTLKQADYLSAKNNDISTFINYMKSDANKHDRDFKDASQTTAAQQQLQKPPLQQQLMQHRLLQQKRQILQKQVALETSLSRRQMLRQQSYKIAQQTQILPPLPLSESESEDLLAFQAIVEGNSTNSINSANSANHSPSTSVSGSPKIMKTSHIQQQQTSSSLPSSQAGSSSSVSSSSTVLGQQQSSSGGDCWNSLSGSMQTCQISDGGISSLDTWSSHPQPLFQVFTTTSQ